MKNLHKVLLLSLVFAFAGQSFVANALPCHMMASSDEQAADMASMDHAAHHMPAGALEVAGNDGDGNCCDTGLCAIGHCQPVATLPPGHAEGSAEYTSVFAIPGAVPPPIHVNDSLYRPPIFR